MAISHAVSLAFKSALSGSCVKVSPFLKALSSWQWFNYCSRCVPETRNIIRLNWDETSLCWFQGAQKGNVFIERGSRVTQNISASARRKYCTCVAFVCDDHAIQKLLPHVLIVNMHIISASEFAGLRRSCPPKITLLRRKSSWVNAEVCVVILNLLAKALAPFMDSAQPILLFDGFGPHYNEIVVNACQRHRIWPIVVPAKLTWLLQILDTHVFFAYKHHIQRAYQLARIRTSDGIVGLAELVGCVYAAIQNVIEGSSWGPAFDHNGFGHSQTKVSARVLSWLQLDSPPCVSSERPTDDQLHACFPRRVKAAVRYIMRPLDSSRVGHVITVATPAMPALRRSTRLPSRADVASTASMSAPSSSTAPAASVSGVVPVGKPLFVWRSRARGRGRR